jgi:GNAT superfamily N-acetyltransferase
MAAVHQASAATAHAHIFDSPFPLDESLRKWAEHTGQAWLARRSQTLLGFATATSSEVDGLYVLPKEAGGGFGSALLTVLGAVSRLWVLQDNANGRRWYEGRGWRASGERQGAYGVWELLYVR